MPTRQVKSRYYVIVLMLLVFWGCASLLHGSDFKKISVTDLLQKMDKAIDPDGILNDKNSKSSIGEVIMPLQKIKASVKSQFKKPDKYIITTTFPDGQKKVQAYNGKTAWKYDSESNKVTYMTGIDKDAFIFNAMLDSPCNNIFTQVFGKIDVDNKYHEVMNKYECYKITCYPEDGFKLTKPYIFYVDNKDFLIRKMKMTVYIHGTPIESSIVSMDYEMVSGIKIAMKTETDIMGSEIEYNIKNIKFDVPSVNDKLFDSPLK